LNVLNYHWRYFPPDYKYQKRLLITRLVLQFKYRLASDDSLVVGARTELSDNIILANKTDAWGHWSNGEVDLLDMKCHGPTLSFVAERVKEPKPSPYGLNLFTAIERVYFVSTTAWAPEWRNVVFDSSDGPVLCQTQSQAVCKPGRYVFQKWSDEYNGPLHNHDGEFEVSFGQHKLELCVRRLDADGWGDRISVVCDEMIPQSVGIGPAPYSRENKRCVKRDFTLCSPTAGNRGERINKDHEHAADTFEIDVDEANSEICAKRTDKGGGWTMDLTLDCYVYLEWGGDFRKPDPLGLRHKGECD